MEHCSGGRKRGGGGIDDREPGIDSRAYKLIVSPSNKHFARAPDCALCACLSGEKVHVCVRVC